MKQYVKRVFSDEITPMETAHKEIAYRAAAEGIVLLENNGVLPLNDKKVALFGLGARHTIKGGTGSGEVNERHSVSIYEGMIDAGFEITSEKWLDAYDKLYDETVTNFDLIQNVKEKGIGDVMGIVMGSVGIPDFPVTGADVKAAEAETAIYVVSRQAGEGLDRRIENGDNDLSEADIAALKLLISEYKNVVLVINVGCSLNMKFLNEVPGLGAVVYFCQQGTEGGHAFADIISGKVNPSGKLTDTWAKKYEDIPFADEYSYLNGNLKDEYYKEGILVGYRYFDSYGVEPQYPFGYGLSYTTFDIDAAEITVDGTAVTVKVNVANTGSIAGKEVVQIYVSAPQGTLKKEAKALAGFTKTDVIEPGQTQTVNVCFDMSDIASYDENGSSYILDAGAYIVKVGSSSADTKDAAAIVLDELTVVEQVKNICPLYKPVDELEIPDKTNDTEGLPVIELKSSAFTTVKHTYKKPDAYLDPYVNNIVNNMSLIQKAQVCVGMGMLGGNRKVKIEGAVGHTTSKFAGRGLINVELADGPAGLRLTRYSGLDEKGNIKMVDSPFSFLNYLPAKAKKFVFADPAKTKMVYQFTTAFPVEIAMAQTWNTALLEEVGKAVSEEMNQFGITYWLAPALNIHRNPLCGRNFEYYSEDPILAGKCAAAITKGVQSIEGNYVTIKHYCANNQEENRMAVSSNVKERALREIYLKAFGIAVKEGGAKGVMTSYNKVNGTYTSNSYDLCTEVLRNEWGFDGVVMTDWFGSCISLFDGSPALAIKAGNDLLMPGLPTQVCEIVAGVKANLLNEEDVDIAARNIVRSIIYSNVAKSVKNGGFDEV